MGNCCFKDKEDDEVSLVVSESDYDHDLGFDGELQDCDLPPNEAEENIKKMCLQILQSLIDNDHSNILGQSKNL